MVWRDGNGPPTGVSPSAETLTDGDQPGALQRPEIAAPHLFVVLDCSCPSAGGTRHSLANIDRVVIGRGQARGARRVVENGERVLLLSLADPYASTQHAALSRRGQSFVAEDLGSHNGTRIQGDAIDPHTALADGDVIEVGHTLLRFRASLSMPLGEPADLDSALCHGDSTMRTLHAPLARQIAALERVAPSPSPVLILGETGSGKEVVARALHRASGRSGPFVAVNCGALPAPLIEAQLFGHVRGAFSGATGDAPGLIRSADGGTLLLDEIGDLPGPSQAALLRVLQEHEVLPVGGHRPVRVDLRVAAATHRPLDELVARGAFRSDLLARIAAFAFHVPPLRDRIDDVGILLSALDCGPLRFTLAAGRALCAYPWPLNVRELHQTARVAAALAGDRAIDLEHLGPAVAARGLERSPKRQVQPDSTLDALRASLARHDGNVSAVARELGKARMQVQRWLRRYGIDARSFRRAP
jgi:hypothetical protein